LASPENLEEVSFEVAYRVAREAASLGAREVAFSGGEPLLWPGVENLVAITAANHMEVTVYSSGVVDNLHGLLGDLAKNGVHKIVFSLHGGDPPSHDGVTGLAGSFDLTIFAIEESAKLGVETEVHFVPMQANWRQLREVVGRAKEAGAQRVSILRFVPHGRWRLGQGMALTHEQNMELQKMVQVARGSMCIRAGSPYNFLLLNDDPACCSGIDRLVVTPDLRVYPCDAFKNIPAEEIAGTDEFSSLQKWSLGECWFRSPYLEKIRMYLQTPFARGCAECRLLEKCVSGCLAQKYLAYGSLNKAPDPMCIRGSGMNIPNE
jgi:pyrroloquinoline quinone biosynthesis protein E